MTPRKVIDRILFEHGLQVSVQEAWPKIISRQFGGEPARGWVEIISNALDAYPKGTDWQEKMIEVEVDGRRIATTDYGEGMSLERLRLLTTLGATDKFTKDKIGRFGLGFAAVMNPALGTRCVTVTTRCEGYTVEIRFVIVDPEKPPELHPRTYDAVRTHRTRVEAEFDREDSAGQCRRYAQSYLTYFPCRALVNKKPYETVWDRARHSGEAAFFREANCDGFVEPYRRGESITVLCRYERIIKTTLPHFLTGGRGMRYDLRDYYVNDFPYLPQVDITVNCEALSVTLSRDGFLLDGAYIGLKRALARVMRRQLGRRLADRPDDDLVLANQFVLRDPLRAYLTSEQRTAAEHDADGAVIQALARARVYRLNGRRKRVSLEEIFDARSPDTPVFYAPRQTNLRWVGGAFRHDFIVLPVPCHLGGGSPGFYDDLFPAVFQDAVNLDTVAEDHEKIRELVERDIVSKRALTPKCRLLGRRALTAAERKLACEFDTLLAHPDVRACIRQQLYLSARAIRTAYFEVGEDGITLATGLFGEDGKPLALESADDCATLDAATAGASGPDEPPVLLGLRRHHPLIEFLIQSENPDRAAYGLTYLARELAVCQQRLVPYSRFYWAKVEQLAAGLRRALTLCLSGSEGGRP